MPIFEKGEYYIKLFVESVLYPLPPCISVFSRMLRDLLRKGYLGLNALCPISSSADLRPVGSIVFEASYGKDESVALHVNRDFPEVASYSSYSFLLSA